MAGTSSLSSVSTIEVGISEQKRVQLYNIAWTADASDATIPDLTISMKGYIIQAVTNPGSTAPTDNYDIVLNEDNGADLVAGALANRSTSASQCVVFDRPPLSAGNVTISISNNAVNSATGVIVIYVDSDI